MRQNPRVDATRLAWRLDKLAAVGAIPGPVTTVFLEGGDHGLRRKDPDVVVAVQGWLGGLG